MSKFFLKNTYKRRSVVENQLQIVIQALKAYMYFSET